MTAIPTYTSSNRPASGAEGSIHWVSDSKCLEIADGSGDFHSIPNQSVNLYGAASQLSYPNGIYSSGGGYSISSTPAYHFDVYHIDGSNPTNLSDGDPVPTWGDCSGNGCDVTQTNVANQPTYKVYSSSNSTHDTFSAVLSSSDYYPVTPLPAIGTEATVFFVQTSNGTSYNTPFNGYSNWINWNNNTSSVLFGRSLNAGATMNYNQNALRIGRLSNSTVEMWSSSDPNGDGTPLTGAAGSTVYGTNFLHTYGMFNFEFLVFNQALTIAEINTVKNYLTNKYQSLVSRWDGYTLTE